jgi:predicted Zn-dependent protease
MRFTKIAIGLTSLCLLSACQSSKHLVDFKNTQESQNLSVGEKRIWSQSDDAVRILHRAGKIMQDDDATAHVNNIANKLYPEFKDIIEIEIVKTPILNAFAFPNGKLFIHSGIIAAAQNDSQLAAVVAHEIVHFTKRHSAKNRISAANTTSFVIFMNVMGIPLLGEFIGISSMAGFSRDLEREADMEAVARMRKAGFDIREAKKLFEFMAADSLANEYDSPWFFASHPDLIERIASFEEYSAKYADNTTVNPEYQDKATYKQTFNRVRHLAIQEKLEIGHYSSLINEYETFYADSIYNTNTQELYYFANAYRLRARKGDKEIAHTLFKNYFANHQDNASAFMHAGVVCMDIGDLDCARTYLETANSMSEQSSGYINMYLKKLESKELSNES